MYHHQQATRPTWGHQGAHRRKASLVRASAALCISTRMTVRPIMRCVALTAAGTGAATALALGPSTPSFAVARTTVVTTNNEAGYQAGNGFWNFRFVQAVVTLPPPSSPQHGCGSSSSPNYVESSLQLIAAADRAAIGVKCRFFSGHYEYRLGWALGYLGNTQPPLDHELFSLDPGDRILLQLFYDQGQQANLKDQTVRFTECLAVGVPAHCQNPVNVTRSVSVPCFKSTPCYKFAVVSANVANPMPFPPTAGTSQILMPFTDAAVTSLNGTHGTPGILGPWGVQPQIETETAVGGNLVANPQPPAPETSFDGTTFNIQNFGKPGIGP
jgi:hypothetical protein